MARNSLESRLMEQSDMIMQLNKMILSLQQTIEGFNAKEAAMLQEIQTLKEQNDYLTKKLFGKSSEKNSWDMDGQLNLFNEAEQEQDVSLLEEEQEETKTVTFTVKKGRSADKDRYAGLPVEKKYLDVPEGERFCPDCESPLLEIGETFVRRELKFKPASFKVVEYYSKNYKCPKCSPNLKTPVIVQGKDGRAHMLHGMASASTVAWVMYQKYVNAMPLYRIERDFKQYGVNITRATLANWVIQNTDRFFSPLYDYLHKLLLQGSLSWQMKPSSRCFMKKAVDRKASPICGFSGVAKMDRIPLSSISILPPEQEKQPQTSWMTFPDISCVTDTVVTTS